MISYFLHDFARRHGAQCPVTVVPNGVAFVRKATLNARPTIPTIITVSRLVHKNGVDVLIRAAQLLRNHLAQPFRVRIVGDGPDREALQQLARELHVQDIVEFVGAVPPDQVVLFILLAHMFLFALRAQKDWVMHF